MNLSPRPVRPLLAASAYREAARGGLKEVLDHVVAFLFEDGSARLGAVHLHRTHEMSRSPRDTLHAVVVLDRATILGDVRQLVLEADTCRPATPHWHGRLPHPGPGRAVLDSSSRPDVVEGGVRGESCVRVRGMVCCQTCGPLPQPEADIGPTY